MYGSIRIEYQLVQPQQNPLFMALPKKARLKLAPATLHQVVVWKFGRRLMPSNKSMCLVIKVHVNFKVCFSKVDDLECSNVRKEVFETIDV